MANSVELTAFVLCIVVAFSSLIGTLLTIWLIYDMKKMTSYLRIILNMTCCQLVYDINFFFLPVYGNGTYLVVTTFSSEIMSTFGGIAVSLWSNLIAYILYYSVTYVRSFNLQHTFRYYFLVIMVLSVAMGVLTVTPVGYSAFEIYYYFRIFSLLVNILLYFLTYYKLYLMGMVTLCGRYRREGCCCRESQRGASITTFRFGVNILTLVF